MKQSEIKFTVSLNEKHVPQQIDWSATDTGKQSTSKAVMISLWDAQENNTLRIDLWTQDMLIDDMKRFYHQSLLSMADTLERATGEAEAAKAMRTFAQQFGERLNLVMRNPLHQIIKD
jgi:gliding motility-associated protein GldC